MKKYYRGRPYKSLEELMIDIANKKNVYHHHKILSFGWYQNWTIRFLMGAWSEFSICEDVSKPLPYKQMELEI